MNKEKNIKLAEFNLKTINGWIEFADKKAAFLLTLGLAFFSISLTSFSKFLEIEKKLLIDNNPLVFLAMFLIAISLFYVLLALIGFYKLINVIKPRLIPKTYRKSSIFYETIKDMELEKFKNEIKKMSDAKIVDELSDQAYNNANVASEKYKNIRHATIFLTIAGVLELIFILIVSIAHMLIF